MDKHYVLSKDDIDIIRTLVRAHRLEENRTTNRPGVQPFVSQSTDVYVALTPGIGIAALTPSDLGTGSFHQGDEPGVAPCYVYRIIYQHGPVGTGTSQALVPVLEQTTTQLQLVYNIGEEDIDGDVWVKVAKDKFGAWLAIDPPPPATYRTGTNCSWAGAAVNLTRLGSLGNVWSNPSRAVGPPDNLFAQTANSTGIDGFSDYILLTQYDFSTIPNGAVIDAITATVVRKATGTNPPTSVIDSSVTLYLAGSSVGSDEASSTVWSTTTENEAYTFPVSGLTIAQVKTSTFGLSLSGFYGLDHNGNDERLNIDAVQICIQWHKGTPPVTPPPSVSAFPVDVGTGTAGGRSTLTGTFEPLTFTAVYDTDGFLPTGNSSSVFTIPTSGIYLLSSNLPWTFVYTGAHFPDPPFGLCVFEMQIMLDSSLILYNTQTAPGPFPGSVGTYGVASVCQMVELTKGQEITVQVRGAVSYVSGPSTGDAEGEIFVESPQYTFQITRIRDLP